MKVQPSFLLASIFLGLGILSLVFLREEPEDETFRTLQKLGWQTVESSPCSIKSNHRYYEIETNTKNRELYIGQRGSILLSPGEPIDMEISRCHSIKKPSFVEEI